MNKKIHKAIRISGHGAWTYSILCESYGFALNEPKGNKIKSFRWSKVNCKKCLKHEQKTD